MENSLDAIARTGFASTLKARGGATPGAQNVDDADAELGQLLSGLGEDRLNEATVACHPLDPLAVFQSRLISQVLNDVDNLVDALMYYYYYTFLDISVEHFVQLHKKIFEISQ